VTLQSIKLAVVSLAALTFAHSFTPSSAMANGHRENAELGPRPFYLVDQMEPSELKSKLMACSKGPFKKSLWSIGHRGAPQKFPEHTIESYTAAARMGAGILECDVTFTKDKQLVCRHSQNDLHTTTNILATSLASTCIKPFVGASEDKPASAECRVSDITVKQFLSLKGRKDVADKKATTIKSFLKETAEQRTGLIATNGTLLSHAQSIELIKSLGAKFTPELKAPRIAMPFGGYTREQYAQHLIDEYKAAGVPPSDVYPQSFSLEDVVYWIEHEPEFGKQAVYLDGSFTIKDWSPENEQTWTHKMADLKAMGVNYIAPPIWVLLKVEGGQMVPSLYAKKASAAGLKIITWTVERSGSLKNGGGWYYQSVADVTDNEGDVMELMHVLHKDVGIVGLFSDWPATTTYYANCFGLK